MRTRGCSRSRSAQTAGIRSRGPPPSIREPATPTVPEFLTTWRADPIAIGFAVLLAGLYISGLVRARRRGARWSGWSTAAFLGLGVGALLWVGCGFLGAWSVDLRWAFSTRIALLLFVVPGLLLLGRPIGLARAAGVPVEGFLGSRVVRVVGSAAFAPLFALAVFLILLTPLAAPLRLDAVSESLLTVLVPLAGLVIALPLTREGAHRVGTLVAVEFVFAFIELLLDALPGILLRLGGTVLDRAGTVAGALPAWFPSALHDQHLSGDFLWFIAEIADVPVLAIFIVQWMRSDRHEAKSVDDLSDDEVEELTRLHLHGPR